MLKTQRHFSGALVEDQEPNIHKALDDFEIAARCYQELIDLRSDLLTVGKLNTECKEVQKVDQELNDAKATLRDCRHALVNLYEDKV
jgi:hypothetical protein